MAPSKHITALHLLGAGVALAATLLLAACGGATGSGSAAAPAGSSATASTSVPTAPAAGAPAVPASGGAAATAPAGAAVKVSANRAPRAELQRAFEAAGIPNAARLAVEVEEYRPYPTTDPGFAKLRQELAKYNIPVAVVDQIVATLTLD